MGKNNTCFSGKMLLSVCWVPGITQQIVTPVTDLARFILLPSSLGFPVQGRMEPPWGPCAQGPAVRDGAGGGSSPRGGSDVNQQHILFSRALHGRAAAGTAEPLAPRTLPVTDAAGDVLNRPRDAARQGEVREGWALPNFASCF